MKEPFDYQKSVLVGVGFLGISAVWPIFNQFVPILLQTGNPAYSVPVVEGGQAMSTIQGFGLSPALALFIMTWDNLINMFVQPWVGVRSDRTWNRFGRRKGWILLGVPIAVLGFVLIPFAKTAVSIAIYILITNIGLAIFRSPATAWLGDLFKPEDRSQANGIINLMGGIGGLTAFFLGGYLFDKAGPQAPFILGGSLVVIASVFVVIVVNEPHTLTDTETASPSVWDHVQLIRQSSNRGVLRVLMAVFVWFLGFNALETGLSSFAVFTLGIPAGQAAIFSGAVTITFILFAVPAGMFGAKYGRKPIILAGLLGLTLLLSGGYFLIIDKTTFAIVMVFIGICWACINVNALPLTLDYGERTAIGAYTGLFFFSSQAAAVVGPTLAGVLIDWLDNEFRWLFLFTAFFMGISWMILRNSHQSTALS